MGILTVSLNFSNVEIEDLSNLKIQINEKVEELRQAFNNIEIEVSGFTYLD